MKQILAFYNHGRWLGVCPKHASASSMAVMTVKPGESFICPFEYPESIAMTFVPDGRPGKFMPVPDQKKRDAARKVAIEAGDGYEVIFPEKMIEIEKALRLRPVAERNWDETMTLDRVWEENRAKGYS